MDKHMKDYNDVYIPFLMPWYGTGVLASGFGIEPIFQDYMDPAVSISTIKDIEQLKGIKKPDPQKDGLMPRVLNTIKYMKKNTDLPVGVTDCQGVLTTALQVLGYDTMIYWMHDYPDKVHEFLQMITDVLIEWVKVQKEAAGQDIKDDAYVLGVKIPTGYGGVWFSDDDSVLFGKELYREFCVPYNSQLLKAFGGGAIHYCGNANQHIDNYLQTEGLTVIHNMCIDDLEGAAKAKQAFTENGIVYILADFNVSADRIDCYYEQLFKNMDTKGLVVVPYIAPATQLNHGKYEEASLDPDATGKVIEKTIKKYNIPR
jgi:uroporphyrinogen-III decarboxylase